MDFQRLAIGVLSYNRKGMLLKTLQSLYACVEPDIFIFDNGSTDGAADLVLSLGGQKSASKNHTTGYGMNSVIYSALSVSPDIILFSADDFVYCEDYFSRIMDFWKHAPEDVKLASCYLEPVWDWNKVQGTADAGNEHYAIRETLPGSNWMFRASDKDLILPIAEKTGGEDIEICRRLTSEGYKLAALDLVEHIGEKASAWGNESWRFAAPIDKKGLGFNDR
jgi:glycosyltransferase involved in cell wall biosynthesis